MERILIPIWPDAAQVLSIGRTTMFNLIQSGEIETVRIGRRHLVPVDAIHVFVERLRNAPDGRVT